MKKVLWISRHEMTVPQRRDLERILGGGVELVPWRDTVRDPAVLAPAIRAADAVAAVLPPALLAGVMKLAEGRPVLQAVSARAATGRERVLPDGRREPEFAFVHRWWEQILRLEVETRRL